MIEILLYQYFIKTGYFVLCCPAMSVLIEKYFTMRRSFCHPVTSLQKDKIQ